MSSGNRILVYCLGFLMGLMLVSLITNRRAAREEARTDPWVMHNAAMLEAGAEPVPERAPDSIQEGLMIDFGMLPDANEPEERVWLLRFDDRYPHVRVVENIASGELSYMAADQIKILLADGVDVTALKPMLDELDLRMRMFNRRERIAVIGVLHTGIDAVPETLEAIQPWAELFEKAGPDWIIFRER